MRSFRSRRFLWAVGGTALLLGLVLPTQALAQAPHLKYTATGVVTAIVAADPASIAKLTAAGIELESVITSTIVMQRNTPDTEPDATKAVYGSYDVSWSLGDGPVTFDVSDMQRHSAMTVQNDQAAGLNGVPFIHDIFAWGGAEPTQESGPSFLALDNWDETQVPPVAKGTAVILVGGAAALPDTSIPESITLASYLIQQTAMDLLDTESSMGQLATITVTGNITSVTVEEVPTVPSMNGWAAAVLLLAMLAAGAVLATRRLRAES